MLEIVDFFLFLRVLRSIQSVLKTADEFARHEWDLQGKKTPEGQGTDDASDSQHQGVSKVLSKTHFFSILLTCLALQQFSKEQAEINKIEEAPVETVEFHHGKDH